MVERGVEDGLLVGRRAIDADAAELALPCCLGPRAGGGEVPVGLFGAKIFERVGGANRGDAAAHLHRLVCGRIEVQRGLQDFAVDGIAIDRVAIGVELRLRERGGELHGEVDLTARRPGVHGAAPGHQAVLGIDGECGGCYGVLRALIGVVQIDDEVRVLRLRREGVLVQAGALGGCEFRVDACVLEQNGVVAGLGSFIVVRKTRAIAGLRIFPRAGHQLDLAGARHDENVEQVAAAGSAEVGVGKTHDGSVAAVVTGAPVPTVVIGVRAELDCAERDSGARKAMAVATGADDDVHVAGHVVAILCCSVQHALRETARKREVGTGGE